MYIESTGELTSEIAKLPEQFEQPTVADLVLGQYALLDVDFVWVDVDGAVRVDSRADLDTSETRSDYEQYTKIILINEGIVLDPLDASGDPNVYFGRTPLEKLMSEDEFDISSMVPVIWVIANTKQLNSLKVIYAKQTGQTLYEPSGLQKKIRRTPAGKLKRTRHESNAEAATAADEKKQEQRAETGTEAE